MRSKIKHSLAPLVLSLAVSQAYAATITLTGTNGVNGTPGSVAFAPTDGTAAPALTIVLGPSADLGNTLTLTGGAGGTGGASSIGFLHPAPGSGGNGADANGSVITSTIISSVAATATVMGGAGGQPGNYIPFDADGNWNPTPGLALSGNGGSAIAGSVATTTGFGNVVSSATAIGGDGAASTLPIGLGGTGGNASATAYGKSDFGNVDVSASASGGTGGGMYFDGNLNQVGSGYGSRGVDIALSNAVSGSTAGVLTLSQSATGGNAGGSAAGLLPVDYFPAPDMTGGSATSTLTLSDATAIALHATVTANGGRGGDGMEVAGGNGGSATATLTLSSTGAGSPVVGTVVANGGNGGMALYLLDGASSDGGIAVAHATLTGLGAVTGTAKATGGNRYDSGLSGAANAGLTLNGVGLVTGTVEAHGAVNLDSHRFFNAFGSADATLSITGGGGAVGSCTATGGAVSSTINSVTSGELPVNLTATATGFNSALASVIVQSNGAANVTGSAFAYGDDSTEVGPSLAPATSNLSINAGGDIQGTSRAVGGAIQDNRFVYINDGDGSANASASGITRGNHAVSLNATALGGKGTDEDFGQAIQSGNAYASAYGKSDRGVVNVTATAQGGDDVRFYYGTNLMGNGTASATAISNGLATAQAQAIGGNVHTSAVAQNAQVRYAATTGNLYGLAGSSYASNQYDATAVALPGLSGTTREVSNVVGAPSDSETATLLASSPALAGQLHDVLGVGMQGAVNGDQWSALHQASTSGDFQFSTTQAGHLLIGFIASSFLGSGFNALDLTISANGAQLYAHTFTSLAEAHAFFNDHVLDLGLLGAGAQDVLISSTYSFLDPAAYAFNYAVDVAHGATAVPEPSSWLMMAIGMAGLMLVARRRHFNS